MSISGLYGLKRPERTAELDIGGASREEIINATYGAWTSFLKSCDKDTPDDTLYDYACALVRPFKTKISGVLTERDVLRAFALGKDEHDENGVYLSALLNETDASMLALGKIKPPRNVLKGVGFCLKPGKIVSARDGVLGLGSCAEGGIVINRGEVHWMSSYAEGGLHINGGYISSTLGEGASGGTFITMNDDVSRGMLAYPKGPAYAIYWDKWKSDGDIRALVGELLEADDRLDAPKMNAIARKIDAHVRKKYTPEGAD